MRQLELAERQVFSQNGEDGIIQHIVKLIGLHSKTYVEIGCGRGDECNTRYLRERRGWSGSMFDMRHGDPAIGLYQQQVTPNNVCALLESVNTPKIFDLLSIDIDMLDFYVLQAILPQYQPRIIVIEYNSNIPFNKAWVVPDDMDSRVAKTRFFGAGMLAMTLLGWQCGYSLVYRDILGVNLFFVRNDYASPFSDWANDVTRLQKHVTRLGIYTGDRHYVDAETLLNIDRAQLPAPILNALLAKTDNDYSSYRPGQDLGPDVAAI